MLSPISSFLESLGSAPLAWGLACVILAAGLGAAGPAHALDPGTVKGTFLVNDEPVTLTHAYAHFHDNTEGILYRKTELRVLVTDREMPESCLRGIGFLPVELMARDGKVRGLLFVMDPENPNEVAMTLLVQPPEGYSPMTKTLSTSGKDLWKNFAYSSQRFAGAIEDEDTREPDEELPTATFSLTIDAPVFHEPEVTADLKGKDAQKSPQADLLRARVKAMADGDIDALQKTATDEANATMMTWIEQSGMSKADLAKMLKEFSGEQKAMLDKIDRVVVRGDRAILIFKIEDGKQWASSALVDGVWKSID